MRAFLAVLLLLASLGPGSRTVAATRALIVAGLGGEERYEEAFERQARGLGDALAELTEDVVLLTGEASERAAVERELAALATRSSSGDTLLFAFIGHGSWDGETFRFNVPGRDFTASALGSWLDAIPGSNQVLLVTGAASGAVQDKLAAPTRTLITATRSGDQRNATVFGRYFTAAIGDETADVDKNGHISLEEAFSYAAAAVERHYDRDGEMATEHPTRTGPEPPLTLARLTPAPAVSSADAHLVARRNELEQDIARLRSLRDSLTQDEYFAELQKLLLEMAMIESQLSADGGEG